MPAVRLLNFRYYININKISERDIARLQHMLIEGLNLWSVICKLYQAQTILLNLYIQSEDYTNCQRVNENLKLYVLVTEALETHRK